MLSITGMFDFCYAHFLPKHKGKCKNLHGHNGKLEIEITGDLNDQYMILDFGDFKKLVNNRIIDKLDHKYINDFIEHPTCENIILYIKDELEKSFDDIKILRIRMYESNTTYSEWKSNEIS